MKNLPRSLSRHVKSTNPIQNQIVLNLFGSVRIDFWLWTNSGDYISVHNAKVRESR